MIPIWQTRFGGSESPSNEQGNCIAACVASIFEVQLAEVPDLLERDWWFVLTKWCQQRGATPIYIAPTKGLLFPETFYILGCKSRTLKPGDGHAVVAWGESIVHDPNPRLPRGVWADYEAEDATMFLIYKPLLGTALAPQQEAGNAAGYKS